METIFLICAAVGGTLLLCQFLLGLFGLGHHEMGHDHDFGHDHDVDHDHDSSWFVGVLTFRAIVTAITFFGLAGLATAEIIPHDDAFSLGIALLAGTAALFVVAWMMKTLHRLKADGTVRIDRAIGKTGTVYLSVPGNNAGAGKVTVKLQNRTVEYLAISRSEALATGTPIQVVAVVGPDTVEVVPVPQAQRISHV